VIKAQFSKQQIRFYNLKDFFMHIPTLKTKILKNSLNIAGSEKDP